MDSAEAEARRLRSLALFGNRYFADVVLAVDALATPPEGLATVRQVAAALGLADSLVRPVILRLAAAQVVVDLPRLGGPRSALHYRVTTSSTWEPLVALASGAAERVR
ncbi:MAG: hypothetical protein H0X25_16125 [Acidobacteriales bacterium]|nr:hypothetical protein [Terriglobales bacterium]